MNYSDAENIMQMLKEDIEKKALPPLDLIVVPKGISEWIDFKNYFDSHSKEECIEYSKGLNHREYEVAVIRNQPNDRLYTLLDYQKFEIDQYPFNKL